MILDISDIIRANDNTITIIRPHIISDNEGMIVNGTIAIQIYDKVYQVPCTWCFVDGTKCADIVFQLLSVTYIKDGGYGFPSVLDIVFNNNGEPIDIIGESTRF